MKRRQNDLFKLPNSIFTAPLNATQLKVLAVFYSLRSRTIRNGKKFVKISQKSLKKMCGIKSTRTISDAANTLCRLGYIERIDRYYDDYKRHLRIHYSRRIRTGFFLCQPPFLQIYADICTDENVSVLLQVRRQYNKMVLEQL